MDYIRFLILFTQVYGKRNFLLPSNYFLKYPEFRIHKLLIEEFFSMFFQLFLLGKKVQTMFCVQNLFISMSQNVLEIIQI